MVVFGRSWGLDERSVWVALLRLERNDCVLDLIHLYIKQDFGSETQVIRDNEPG